MTRTKVTPPELAERWGVNPDKILFFINSGELRAIDASLLPGQGKPRYLIDEADIEAFELSRQVQPPLPSARRKPQPTPVGFVRHFRQSENLESEGSALHVNRRPGPKNGDTSTMRVRGKREGKTEGR